MKFLGRIMGLLLACTITAGAASNLVFNGSFEMDGLKGWSASGNPQVKQTLTLAARHAGGSSAKLVCTEFSDNGPDFHAMICQVGKASVRKGQWYRMKFWAKAEELKAGGVELALVTMGPWENAGLAEAFTPEGDWELFEFVFRATTDLAPEKSRLQFWLKSTGTLWLDDVEMTETARDQEWFPQIETSGVKNFVPNSSLECGC